MAEFPARFIEVAVVDGRTELPMLGICWVCRAEVGRAVEWDGDHVVISPWGHLVRRLDAQHQVRRVLPSG